MKKFARSGCPSARGGGPPFSLSADSHATGAHFLAGLSSSSWSSAGSIFLGYRSSDRLLLGSHHSVQVRIRRDVGAYLADGGEGNSFVGCSGQRRVTVAWRVTAWRSRAGRVVARHGGSFGGRGDPVAKVDI